MGPRKEGRRMANPFPGMDPYLEPFWGDFHTAFITYARDQLQPRLPGDLRARIEERVYVESAQRREKEMVPDIRIVERGHAKRKTRVPRTGIAVAEPLTLALRDDPVTEGYIQILDVRSGRRVITIIEVLSPSNNRPGPGR